MQFPGPGTESEPQLQPIYAAAATRPDPLFNPPWQAGQGSSLCLCSDRSCCSKILMVPWQELPPTNLKVSFFSPFLANFTILSSVHILKLFCFNSLNDLKEKKQKQINHPSLDANYRGRGGMEGREWYQLIRQSKV